MPDSSKLNFKPIATHTPEQASQEIAHALVTWFQNDGKSYPWRETTDPYAILVSEIMLQQTQIATVLGKGFYTRWMERFPNTQTLASANEDQVLKQWEGLGYYSRARNLQKLAQYIENELEGNFPTEHEDILKLPGVGPYTAGAVVSFAFDQPAPIVDGNVARVLSRLYNEPESIDSPQGKKLLWQRSEFLLDHQNPRDFNSAIMELGQRICKKSSPQCWECQIAFSCLSTQPETLPIKKQKTQIIKKDEWITLYLRQNSQTLKTEVLLQEIQSSRRKGLWGFPERSEQKDPEKADYQATYAITKYKVKLFAIISHEAPQVVESARWLTLKDTEKLAVAAPYRKIINWLSQKDN